MSRVIAFLAALLLSIGTAVAVDDNKDGHGQDAPSGPQGPGQHGQPGPEGRSGP
jgi:hypothetical protein